MSLIGFVCYRVFSIALFWCGMKALGIGVLMLLLHIGREKALNTPSWRE
ncbi:hypothetical protein HA052_20125 [Chromobacterium haemolyticum]|uniref:Uncharacterized protein n=1 Tax=Chromobacterium fluminis TaxID=3044269 RepID=A0ABX0LGE0_9NEIS|nr:hypothetical protein [Chromobacterium haemolyticum]NHR07500.1 hypothetical protein [Chromobacterium haemolyticum]